MCVIKVKWLTVWISLTPVFLLMIESGEKGVVDTSTTPDNLGMTSSGECIAYTLYPSLYTLNALK